MFVLLVGLRVCWFCWFGLLVDLLVGWLVVVVAAVVRGVPIVVTATSFRWPWWCGGGVVGLAAVAKGVVAVVSVAAAD